MLIIVKKASTNGAKTQRVVREGYPKFIENTLINSYSTLTAPLSALSACAA